MMMMFTVCDFSMEYAGQNDMMFTVCDFSVEYAGQYF